MDFQWTWLFGWDTPFALLYAALGILALVGMVYGIVRGIAAALMGGGFPWLQVGLCVLTGGWWAFVWWRQVSRVEPTPLPVSYHGRTDGRSAVRSDDWCSPRHTDAP